MKLVKPSVPSEHQSTSSISSTDPTLVEFTDSGTMNVYRPSTNAAEKQEKREWKVGWSEALRFVIAL
jgi:hypothetical protein